MLPDQRLEIKDHSSERVSNFMSIGQNERKIQLIRGYENQC